MRDVWTVVWREWKELAAWDRGWVTLSSLLALALLVGVLLPWQVGRPWLRAPWVVLFWAWMPLFLVTTVVADTFAGERERRTLEALLATPLSDGAILTGKIAATVSWVWGATLLCLPLAVLTVNAAYGSGELLAYRAGAAAGIAAVALLAALLGAAIGVLVSLRAASVRQAQQLLAIVAVALFLLPLFAVRALPPAWAGRIVGALLVGNAGTVALGFAGVLALLDALLLPLVALRFRRGRLLLD